MVDIFTLKNGDRVRIVDHWVPGCRQNRDGYMDQYLGTEMTVDEVEPINGIWYGVRMKEDYGRWYWYGPAIDYVVVESEENFDLFEDCGLLDDFCRTYGGNYAV